MAQSDTTSAQPATTEPFAFLAPGGAPALAEEMLDLWACGCSAWAAYATRLASTATPAGWIDANTRLMAEGLDLCSRAAALRLRHAGLAQPLLSDA